MLVLPGVVSGGDGVYVCSSLGSVPSVEDPVEASETLLGVTLPKDDGCYDESHQSETSGKSLAMNF